MKAFSAPLEFLLDDAGATEALGARLVAHLLPGMVLTLSGDLGAGKTTLVRGMLRGLGFAGPVKSPSYALVEEYLFSGLSFYHFDFYRFRDPSEWDFSGFSEYFRNDALCVIEWPEKLRDRLPPVDWAVSLQPVAQGSPSSPAEGRLMRIAPVSEKGGACLAAMEFPQP